MTKFYFHSCSHFLIRYIAAWTHARSERRLNVRIIQILSRVQAIEFQYGNIYLLSIRFTLLDKFDIY